MTRVAQVDLAKAGKGHAVTSVPRWHDAIEHVDAASDSFHQIVRRADAHQIAWPVRGHPRNCLLDHREHDGLRFADRKTANGVAVETDLGQFARACVPQFRIVAALNDSEQHASLGCSLEGAPAALGPAQRELHGALDVVAPGRQTNAFVELHRDVGAEQPLYVDRALRRQFDRCAVDVGSEGDSVFLHFSQLRQRHHLKAAGIRQHGSVPGGEFLQAAEVCDPPGAGTQHQVIGVAEDDIGPGVAHLAPLQALHGALRPDGHERRRSHRAMRRGEKAGASLAVAAEQLEMIGEAHAADLPGNSRQASP